ncbi:MAG: hypothetical protein JEZ00_19360 [Anaerolineaceae bacterium]|nr:hypothetical protein [Anaerolineaceae bacterium]
MAKTIADGVVEAVRYDAQKNISLARVFLRRGAIYSDCMLLTRETLIDAMQDGKNFFSGSRKPYVGSTFFINQKLNLHEQNGNMFIGVTTSNSPQDDPDLAPLF